MSLLRLVTAIPTIANDLLQLSIPSFNIVIEKIYYLTENFTHVSLKISKTKLLLSMLLNSIQEKIKCRLKAGNSRYYSVQTLLSSSLLDFFLRT